jgi:hypothetical protein
LIRESFGIKKAFLYRDTIMMRHRWKCVSVLNHSRMISDRHFRPFFLAGSRLQIEKSPLATTALHELSPIMYESTFSFFSLKPESFFCGFWPCQLFDNFCPRFLASGPAEFDEEKISLASATGPPSDISDKSGGSNEKQAAAATTTATGRKMTTIVVDSCSRTWSRTTSRSGRSGSGGGGAKTRAASLLNLFLPSGSSSSAVSSSRLTPPPPSAGLTPSSSTGNMDALQSLAGASRSVV